MDYEAQETIAWLAKKLKDSEALVAQLLNEKVILKEQKSFKKEVKQWVDGDVFKGTEHE